MSEFVMDRTKSEFDMRVSKKMSTHLEKPSWSPKQKLALSARILANQGHGSGLAGQVTARGEKPGTMWTGRFGLGLEEFRSSNFLLVDEDLNVIEGEGMANPANRFHLWIYRLRPDVNSIVHTHPPKCVGAFYVGGPLKTLPHGHSNVL